MLTCHARLDPDIHALPKRSYEDDELMRQLLPDADVASVVGSLSRPFHISRAELQGEFELSGTVDLRNIDNNFLKPAS